MLTPCTCEGRHRGWWLILHLDGVAAWSCRTLGGNRKERSDVERQRGTEEAGTPAPSAGEATKRSLTQVFFTSSTRYDSLELVLQQYKTERLIHNERSRKSCESKQKKSHSEKYSVKWFIASKERR